MADEFKKVVVVYTGLRCQHNGKLSCTFQIIGGEWDGEKLSFDKCKELDKIPGEEYEGLYNGSSIKTRLEWIGTHGDQDLVVDSQVSDKMAKTTSNVIKKQAKAKRESDTIIKDCLRPLSKAYHSTNAVGKTAMIAQVIDYMQREL